MSHHGDDVNEHMLDQLRAELNAMRSTKPGPTGRFPNGRMSPTDEGQIGVAIATVNGRIVMDFGKPIAWVGLTVDDARGIAESLNKHADALAMKSAQAAPVNTTSQQ